MAKVALVLGSGGARGYSHIGVIRALQERDMQIVSISGSSMGALIGGVYACGQLEAYTEWVCTLSKIAVIRLLDLSFGNASIKGDKLFAKLADMTGDPQIEDLPLGYTAVATDIAHHKEIWFQSGSLWQAIRASVAVPGLFTPVVQQTRILVDGGVLNPLPITPVVSDNADLIIAVDLNAYQPLSMLADSARLPHGEQQMVEQPSLLKRLLGSSEKGIESQAGRLDIALGALEVMQGTLSQYKTAGYPPDLLIKMPTDICQFHEFYRAEEVIERGYTEACKALDSYCESLAQE